MKKITVGDVVPSFTLQDQNGVNTTINATMGVPLVIYFYPKDDTPGCIKEACKFRDDFEKFNDLHVTVIGISADNVASHKKFEEKYNINLWQVVYSDIIFNKFNKYYKFKANEILSIFEQECLYFEAILDEVNPDFLIIRITDSSDSQILHLMCKARGIKILTQEFSRLGLRETISSEPEIINSHKNNEINQRFTFEELQNYSKKYQSPVSASRARQFSPSERRFQQKAETMGLVIH